MVCRVTDVLAMSFISPPVARGVLKTSLLVKNLCRRLTEEGMEELLFPIVILNS